MSYKDDTLKQLEEGFASLKQGIAGLGDDQMLTTWLGDWNTRDILAHVAGWHREMGAGLERIGRGERPTPDGVDYSDGDAWNARFADAKSSLSPQEMLKELEDSFQFYRRAAAALPEDRWEQGRTVDRIVHTSGINHYIEHGEQIKEWRKSL
jgi:uncharacterized protein (TIGR03083 family)